MACGIFIGKRHREALIEDLKHGSITQEQINELKDESDKTILNKAKDWWPDFAAELEQFFNKTSNSQDDIETRMKNLSLVSTTKMFQGDL